MPSQSRLKQERVIEAVRSGLDGDEALEFVHQSGYALTARGIARHLKALGGRGKIREQIEAGLSNKEILAAAFPEDDLKEVPEHEPEQPELFESESSGPQLSKSDDFEHKRITLTIPSDLYQALSLASRAEGKTRSELLVDILTSHLSSMPLPEDE